MNVSMTYCGNFSVVISNVNQLMNNFIENVDISKSKFDRLVSKSLKCTYMKITLVVNYTIYLYYYIKL